MSKELPVAVSIVTGFLGSGKTTLLNRLLDQGALANAALIINEFGDVGIDHLLIESSDEGIVELSDGCLCCTIRGDLVDTLIRLLDRKRSGHPLERIVIETTGLADPAPILHAVMGHPALSDQLRLDGVITVVDLVVGSATLDEHEEAVKQVAVADRIVCTKGDLRKASDDFIERLQRLNPSANLIIGIGDEDVSTGVFNCGLYDPETKSLDVQNWLRTEALSTHHHHHHGDVNRHDARIRAFTLRSSAAVDSASLATFIDLLRSAHGPKILRMKGIIKIKEQPNYPVVIHGVQEVFHPPVTLPSWPGDDRDTRLVMITRDLSEEFVRKLFDAFMGHTSVDTADKSSLENNPLAVPGYSGDFSDR